MLFDLVRTTTQLGNDEASTRYVRAKARAAERVGIRASIFVEEDDGGGLDVLHQRLRVRPRKFWFRAAVVSDGVTCRVAA